MSGFFAAGGHRLPHVPHPHVDHDSTALSMPVLLLAQGLVEAAHWGRLLPFLFGWVGVGSAMKTPLGVLLANVLLWRGVLPISFADYDEYVEDGAVLAEYPHARREMGKELVFCSIIVAGSRSVVFTQSFQHFSAIPLFGLQRQRVIGFQLFGAAVVVGLNRRHLYWAACRDLGTCIRCSAAGALLGCLPSFSAA